MFSGFITALNFAAQGIVIHIKRAPIATYYWNCSWWSDYSEEDERLFIGGLQPFTFTTIRDIRTKTNYVNFIEPLSMFNRMMIGDSADLREITDGDLNFLRLLIESEIGGDAASTGYPYIDRLFHHYVDNQQDVVFNLEEHRYEVETWDDIHYYGFKKWRSLWFKDIADDQSLDISLFLKLFGNLRSFAVFHRSTRWLKSVRIDDQMMDILLDSVSMIKSDKSLSKSFERLIVVDPDMMGTPFVNLEDVIEEYNDRFEELGWKMAIGSFTAPFNPSAKCDESLFIIKQW